VHTVDSVDRLCGMVHLGYMPSTENTESTDVWEWMSTRRLYMIRAAMRQAKSSIYYEGHRIS
jgi:hypothetical protein